MAASMMSTPSSTAASTEAAEMPEVSWVWKCSGRSVVSRSARNSTRAEAGLIRPAMSLIAMMWAPARSSSRAMPT